MPFLFPASALVHRDIMKPLDDVQGNFSYRIKVSISKNIKYQKPKVPVYYQKGAEESITFWKYGTVISVRR